MRDLPELKNPRWREVPRRRGDGVKRILQGFFKLGPNAEKYAKANPKSGDFYCPAGPGLSPVPVGGRWYDVSPYLLRCVYTGDLAEGSKKEIEAVAKNDAPAKGEKKADK